MNIPFKKPGRLNEKWKNREEGGNLTPGEFARHAATEILVDNSLRDR